MASGGMGGGTVFWGGVPIFLHRSLRVRGEIGTYFAVRGEIGTCSLSSDLAPARTPVSSDLVPTRFRFKFRSGAAYTMPPSRKLRNMTDLTSFYQKWKGHNSKTWGSATFHFSKLVKSHVCYIFGNGSNILVPDRNLFAPTGTRSELKFRGKIPRPFRG